MSLYTDDTKTKLIKPFTSENFRKLVNKIVRIKTMDSMDLDTLSDFDVDSYYTDTIDVQSLKDSANDCAVAVLNNQCDDLNMQGIF
jgi:hypothetical protein|tara:strand:+ start:92 stop:349 length:258 start_codon:yes stop_codon:yes gene_type:complete